MDDKKVARINELYHKSKETGLTEAEKKEQKKLRQEYLAAIRKTYPSLKIAALTSSLIDNQLLSDYDTTISINDDIETICSKIKEAVNEPDEESSEQDALSAREKEIIGCVVKGMTNKAIADTLSISIYTVITHRRNISRKLQIHSPAGLAIYAIANNLVNIEDIKDVIN